MRRNVSIAKRLADNSDAEIRNAVEGFSSELEIAERADSAFLAWWEGLPFFSRPLGSFDIARGVFVAGAISMARDLGHLPEGGAA